MNGFLLIDKPAGISSNQVLNLLKQKTKIKKMGHTGTLDPFATGLLVVSVGEASKVIPYLKEEPKIYEATLKLGESTDTLDPTGSVVESKTVPDLTEETIVRVFRGFLGKQVQVPPMFSAKKSGGKKLYELARQGLEIKRQPQEIEIFDLQFVGATLCGCPAKKGGHTGPPLQSISFRVSCSRGTYVRVLGADMACALKTVGHLTGLRRVQAGEFCVEEAVGPESDFRLEERLIPMTAALGHLPSVALSSLEAEKIKRGQPVFPKIPSPWRGEGQGEGRLESTRPLSPSPQGRGETGPVVLLSGDDFLGIGEFRGGEAVPGGGDELWPKRLIQ